MNRSRISRNTWNNGFRELPTSLEHFRELLVVPFHHRDPFDRLLVAQARTEGLILVTGDKKLAEYGIPILLV